MLESTSFISFESYCNQIYFKDELTNNYMNVRHKISKKLLFCEKNIQLL